MSSTKNTSGTSDTEEEGHENHAAPGKRPRGDDPAFKKSEIAAYASKRDRREESEHSDADESFPARKRAKPEPIILEGIAVMGKTGIINLDDDSSDNDSEMTPVGKSARLRRHKGVTPGC